MPSCFALPRLIFWILLEKNHDIHLILPMYSNLVRECVQTRSLDQASQFYDLMEDQVLGKNEGMYSQFLKSPILCSFSCSWNQQISDFTEPKTDHFSLYFEFCR